MHERQLQSGSLPPNEGPLAPRCFIRELGAAVSNRIHHVKSIEIQAIKGKPLCSSKAPGTSRNSYLYCPPAISQLKDDRNVFVELLAHNHHRRINVFWLQTCRALLSWSDCKALRSKPSAWHRGVKLSTWLALIYAVSLRGLRSDPRQG